MDLGNEPEGVGMTGPGVAGRSASGTIGKPRGGVIGAGLGSEAGRLILIAMVGRSWSHRQDVSLAARSAVAKSSAVWNRLPGSLARARFRRPCTSRLMPWKAVGGKGIGV